MIKEVTVSAYRISGKLLTTPGSISVLTSNQLRTSESISLANALSSVPGITVQSGTPITNRLVIRGMGSRTPYNTNRIRAYLNDIPLTSADGISTPEEIDISGLGRIEIIKGPASALYGSGLGGSINMYTPTLTEKELTAEARYGSFNTMKFNASGTVKAGKNILWGSVGHLYSSGFRENNDYRRTAMIGTSRLEHTGWSLNTTVLLMGVRGGIPSSLGITQFTQHPEQAATSWKAIKGYEEYFKGMTAITLNNNLTEKITSQVMLFGKLNNNYEKRPFNNLDDGSLNGGMRFKLSYQSKKAELLAGAEWFAEKYGWKLDINDSLINSNAELSRQLNIFSMVNYNATGKIKISIAAALNRINYRLEDRYPENGDQSGRRSFPLIFSPRIGINYSPVASIALYISAGHGFSLPSPEETLLPEGTVNPGIKPERGIQYEAGIRINGSAHQADVSLYRINLIDLLVTKRLTEDIFTGINAGRTKHQGIEVSVTSAWLRKETFPGRISSVLSYTGSINRFIYFTDNNISYDGKYLPGIPFKELQLQLKWEPWKSLELSARFQYTGQQYVTDDNSLKYHDYNLCDVRAESRINLKNNAELILSAGINNVTDTHYASMLIVNALALNNSEPRYYYPGMPRNIFAALQLVF
jgi:iron complex outermembrane receptor protein